MKVTKLSDMGEPKLLKMTAIVSRPTQLSATKNNRIKCSLNLFKKSDYNLSKIMLLPNLSQGNRNLRYKVILNVVALKR